jgi:hypothetical protein
MSRLLKKDAALALTVDLAGDRAQLLQTMIEWIA